MLKPGEPVHYQSLADGLVIRTAADEWDVERVAELNGTIHGAGITPMTLNLFLRHPHTTGRDLIFVEDERTRQVISSLCVIPWTLRYGDVALPSGEMGIVGTLAEYRRRGLVRAQVAFFKERLKERGCLLSHIQGIPYYYRQFGYEYAFPLDGNLHLELREVPKPPLAPFSFRLATLADLPELKRLYDDAARDLAISAMRDDAIWRYLLTCTENSEMECEIWLIADETGKLAGYLRLPRYHFGEELMVNEASRLSADAAWAALHHLRTLAEQRAIPGLRLNVPRNSTLMQVASALSSRDYSSYAWQIHVPDMTALLQALAPVFEQRIANSAFAGLTTEVQICLYRETIAFRFEGGTLAGVANLGYGERGQISFPPLQFVTLVLGWRSIDELRSVFPDVNVAPTWRPLLNTLFPKSSSFLYTVY